MSLLRRQGATALLLLPGGLLLVLAGWLFLEKPGFIRHSLVLVEIAEVMKQTQGLVSELQNERGRTAQFLSSGDGRYREALESQWHRTDIRRAAYLQAARNLAGQYPEVSAFPTRAETFSATIDRLREAARRSQPTLTVVEEYSGAIAAIQSAVTDLPRDTSLGFRLATYWQLGRIKESLGQQRAIGSIGFVEGRFTFPVIATLLEQRGRHDAFVEAFLAHTGGELRHIYESEIAVSNGALKAYFDEAVASAETSQRILSDPDGWFSLLSQRMEKLRSVEHELVTEIDRIAQSQLADTIVTLVAAVLGVVIIQLLLLTRLFRSESSARIAEKRLARVIDNISEGFALWDAADRLVLCNRYFREICQATACQTMDRVLHPGTPFADLIEACAKNRPYETPDETRQWVERRLATHRTPGGPQEIRLGEHFWVRVSEHKAEDGSTVAVYSDITDMKQREAALREARHAADLANRAKTEFLANMSHEFRTPLNAIIGFSEIMREEMMGPLENLHYKRYAGDIRDAGSRLLQLVEDVLDMARMENGTVALREEPVDLRAAMQSALTVIGERAAQRQIGIAVQIDPALPGLRADAGRLKQVFVNLLSNAVKFTPERGAIVVAAERDEVGGLRVTVSDTGIGIPPDTVAKVLAPFGQADSGLARRFDGAGLGLPLCKSIMDLHQGTLEIAGCEGGGTAVTLRFPAERLVASPAPEPLPA
ncbi:MAG: nitrate- and nitrite sensing domain-containing protein [Rhodospirillales bacterium]|nr:nitrate- and nitrite sensing domain-containing protein [Rhodospirillales bacterium]